MVLARELTKLHEEIFRGTLADAVARYEGDSSGSGSAEGGGGGGGGTSTAATSGSNGRSGNDAKDPRGEFTVVLGPRVALGKADGGAEGAARAKEALEARWVMLWCRPGFANTPWFSLFRWVWWRWR